MAFEPRNAGDPATAKVPRKRAAARALEAAEAQEADPTPPAADQTPVDLTPDNVPAADAPARAVAAQSAFGTVRPQRARAKPAPQPPEPVDVNPAGRPGDPDGSAIEPEAAGGFATRGPRRRTAAASNPDTPAPSARRPVAAATVPLAAVPSVEAPATLLRDDRIPQQATGDRVAVKTAAAPAPAAASTPVSAATPASATPTSTAAPSPPGAAPSPAAAAPEAPHEPDLASSHEAVVVTLGGGRYGIPMDAVDEVGRPPSVTRVPGLPAWLAGVANWRGRVLAVIDLRPLLAASQAPLGRTGRLVVCSLDGVTVGLLTEQVEGVVTVEREATEQPLVTLVGQAATLIGGQVSHARGPIALLDLDAIFALRTQLPRARRAG